MFKRDKVYKYTAVGIAEMHADMIKAKTQKINTITSVVVIGSFFAFGILSKEIFMVMAAGKIINIATDIVFG